MNTYAFLYAGALSSFADKKLFDGLSAREKTRLWAQNLAHCAGVEILDTPLTVSELLHKMDAVLSEKHADHAVFAWADCPFLNAGISERLVSLHTRYAAEYTFADGYPYGFAPEVLAAGTVRILAALADSKPDAGNVSVGRESIFELIKTDINSFEIETFISARDYRYLRLNLSCSSKRDTLACTRLFSLMQNAANVYADGGIDADAVCDLAAKSAEVQRTFPAFYNVQICTSYAASDKKAQNGMSCIYEPIVPKKLSLPEFMDVKDFEHFIDKAFNFSDDAVIGLSFLGDPVYHPQFTDFARAVLRHPNFSLLIETDGQTLDEHTARTILSFAPENPLRITGYPAVNWIIKLDAADKDGYEKLHPGKSFERAVHTVEFLQALFPRAVYPQLVRMKCNENQLEHFFRQWKADGSGNLIVQKYDPVSGFLKDERTADLSPAVRTPCWHIKRDVCVLSDGSVPRCKAAVFAAGSGSHCAVGSETSGFYGNVFTEELQTLWERGTFKLQEQLDGIYSGQCGTSDEYYTFNF